MGKNAEYNNDVIPVVNDTVEIFFDQSGTDTTVNPFKWYFDLTKPAKAIFIQTDQISQITEINGVTLKSPKPLAANAPFSDNIHEYQYMKYTQIKVKVLVANTLVEVFGRT